MNRFEEMLKRKNLEIERKRRLEEERERLHEMSLQQVKSWSNTMMVGLQKSFRKHMKISTYDL